MIQAICWTLIHSLWQGLLLTFLTGIVLVYTKKAAAALRYNLLSGLFFLFLVGCALTFIQEWNNPGRGDAGLNGAGAFSENRLSSFVGTLNDYLSEHASLIVMGWCFIFLFKCVRMTAAIVYTQRVRNYGVVEPPAYWKDKLQSFCGTLQIKRRVLLLESRGVKIPFVTGHWKPVILIPLGLLTKLPEGEIEVVLLHELAHIRRNDVFMNFLQNIGESIFFFNPGLLWVSSLLREERENCCDDMAIDRTKNKVAFVRALIHFREHDLRLAGVAVAFPAGKHQLLHRVRRIVDNKNKSLNGAERIFFIASFFIISLLLVASTHQVVRPADSGYKPVGAERTNVPPTVPAQPDPAQFVAAAAPGIPGLGDDPGQSNELAPPGSLAYDEDVQIGDRKEFRHRILIVSDKRAESAKDAEQALRNKKRTEEAHPEEEAAREAEQVEEAEQAERDRVQAEKDRVQAEKDQLQAAEDRRQVAEDQEQARLDKLQAEQDREQERLEKVEAAKAKVQVSVAIARTTVTRTSITRTAATRPKQDIITREPRH